jgi:hypothetical protein
VKKALLILLLLVLSLSSVSAWRILYKEQYYKLYHEKFYHYPEDTTESMYYLEQALKADFANPLFALAKINDKADWERYRYLFMMHVNLRLVYLSLTLGSKYDKMVAYFYNEPWKRQNLESLQTADQVYRSAFGYWDQAKKWSAQAWAIRDIHLEQIQEWEDESARIETGDLDYGRIIDEQLARVQKVRAAFQAMDQTTY